MADIIPASNKKRLSTRVDLTPMVDLGFLLITFFIFTTTLSEATSMKLALPKDDLGIPPIPTAASKTLNLILAGNNKIWYYRGDHIQDATLIDYNAELRTIIADMRKAVQQKYNDPKEMVVLIKPTSASTYKNVVDVLDEMTIGDVKRYTLIEPDQQEQLLSLK